MQEQIKKINQAISSKLKFDEESHTYTNIIDNYNYRNVTSLLTDFNDALYVGFDIDPEKKERIMKRAGVIGTAYHKALENFIKQIAPFEIDDAWWLKQGLKNAVAHFSQDVKTHNIELLSSEIILTNDQYQIAGTVDLIYKSHNKVYLCDFKTSVRTPENVGKKRAVYALQLAWYKMLAQSHGIQVDGVVVYWIDKRKGDVFLDVVSESLLAEAELIVNKTLSKSSELAALTKQYINKHILNNQ